MKRTFTSLGVAFLVASLAWLTIIVFTPTMYVEKAGNIIVLAFIGAAIITFMALRRRQK
jgi:drug/metabolite transporter superfamily protein YnfA